MANEFVARNGLIAQDTSRISGSLLVTGGNIGVGTAIPANRLHVIQDSSTAGISVSGVGTNPQLRATDGTRIAKLQALNDRGLVGTESNNDFSIFTNNSEIVRITTTGNVGISSTAPTSKLQVIIPESTSGVTGVTIVGNTNSKVLALGAAATYAFVQSHGSVPLYINELGNNVIINPAAGNVGIGTTSPGYKLDISGSIRIPNSQYLYINSSAGTATQVLGVDAGDNTVINTPTGGDIYIRSAGNTIARFISSGTVYLGGTSATASPKVAILTGGSVGIGTTSPISILDVRGATYISGTLSVGTTSTAGTGLTIGGSTVLLGFAEIQQGNIFYFYNSGNTSNTALQQSGTNFLIQPSTGNVGIGTASPGAKLDVVGNVRAQSFTGSFSGSAAAPGSNSQIIFNSSGSLAASSGFVFTGTNVGIGANSPAYLLEVSGSVGITGGNSLTFGSTGTKTATIRHDAGGLVISANIQNQYLSLGSSPGSSQNFPNGIFHYGGAHVFYSSTTEVARIDTSGNVGIGTSAPVNKIQANYSPVAIDSLTATAGTGSTNWNRNAGVLITGASISNGLAIGVSGTANDRKTWIQAGHPDTAANSLGSISLNPLGGNVGIGTSAPTGALDIYGNISIGIRGATTVSSTYNSTTRNQIIYTNNSSFEFYEGVNERVRIATGGIVGIGTTSPSSILDAVISSGATSGFRFKGYSDAATPYLLSLGTYSYPDQFQIKSVNGLVTMGIVGATGANPDLAFQTNTTERMRITTAGNIGIGTTVPSAKLQVSGSSNTVNVKGSGSALFSVDGTVGRLFQVDDSLSGSLFSVNTAAGLPVIEAFSDNTVRIGQFGQRALFVSQSRVGIGLENPTANLHVSGTTGGVFEVDGANAVNALYISSSGNVGIGTTSPIARLHINPTTTNEIALAINGTQGYSNNNFQRIAVGDIASINRLSIGFGYNSTPEWTIRYSSYHNHEFYTGNDWGSSTEKMRITSTGNVGIGTTSPTKLLHVYTSANEGIFLQGTGGGVWMDMKSAGGSIHSIGAQNNGMGIYNRTTGSYRFFITDIGNIGIGTETPGAKLDVNGNVRATSFTGSFSGSAAAPGSNTQVIFNSSGSLAASSGFIFNGTSVGIGTTTPTYRFEVSDGTRTGVFNPNSVLDGFFIGTKEAKPLLLGTTDTERMRITSGGNVGIGTTSPSYKVHIKSSGLNTIPLAVQRAANTNNIFYIYEDASGHGTLTVENSAGTTGAFIHGSGSSYFNGGNVGIGTTTPAERLHVDAGSGIGARIVSSGASGIEYHNVNGTWKVYIGTESGGGGARYNSADSQHTFYNNSSQVVRINSSGNLLVGNSNNYTRLSISNGTSTRTGLTLSDGNTASLMMFAGSSSLASISFDTFGLRFVGGSTVGTDNGTEFMRISTAGNVGIGTTTTPQKLTVSNNIILGTTVTGATATPAYIDLGNSFSNATTRDKLKIYLYNSGTEQYGFGIGSSGDVQYHSNVFHDFYNNNSLSVRINASGNVGIGTSSPSTKLDVQGGLANFGQTAAVGSAFRWGSFGTAVSPDTMLCMNQLWNGSGWTILNSSYGTTALNLGTPEASPSISFLTGVANTAASTKMIILNGGSVGIGTTSPAAKLSVELSGAANQRLANFRNTGGNSFIEIQSSGAGAIGFWTAADNSFSIYQNSTAGTIGTSVLYISSSSNVGIGTTAPSSRLDVYTSGTTGTTSMLLLRRAAGYGYTLFEQTYDSTYFANGKTLTLKNDSGTAFAHFAGNNGGTQTNFLLPTGNVGIGSASPAYPLDVNGTARVTSLIETSTREKKDNIQSYSTDINKFKQLEPVSFTWKDTGKSDVGLIAEEVDQLFPEFVSKTEDGEVTGINYGKLTTILINIVKQQQERIEKLEQQINK